MGCCSTEPFRPEYNSWQTLNKQNSFLSTFVPYSYPVARKRNIHKPQNIILCIVIYGNGAHMTVSMHFPFGIMIYTYVEYSECLPNNFRFHSSPISLFHMDFHYRMEPFLISSPFNEMWLGVTRSWDNFDLKQPFATQTGKPAILLWIQLSALRRKSFFMWFLRAACKHSTAGIWEMRWSLRSGQRACKEGRKKHLLEVEAMRDTFQRKKGKSVGQMNSRANIEFFFYKFIKQFSIVIFPWLPVSHTCQPARKCKQYTSYQSESEETATIFRSAKRQSVSWRLATDYNSAEGKRELCACK